MDRRNTSSDPYVKVRIKGEKNFEKTNKEENTLNPEWHEQIKFKNVKRNAEIEFEVWDWNAWPLVDDFLGKATVKLNEVIDKTKTREIRIMPGDKVKKQYERNKLLSISNCENGRIFVHIREDKHVSVKFGNLEKPKKMQLRGHIYKGKSITNDDKHNRYKSFVQIRFCDCKSDKKGRSQESLDPVWNKSFRYIYIYIWNIL